MSGKHGNINGTKHARDISELALARAAMSLTGIILSSPGNKEK
jgi:hypothetical protein